jgi:hypothetical protein
VSIRATAIPRQSPIGVEIHLRVLVTRPKTGVKITTKRVVVVIIRLVLNELFGTLETGLLTVLLPLSVWMRFGRGRSRVLAAPPTQRTARTRREALVAAELGGDARDARALPCLSGFVGGAETPPVMLVAIFFCDVMSACIALRCPTSVVTT